MSLFLLTFFTLYTMIHVYFFRKICITFPVRTVYLVFLALFMVIMIFAPILIRQSERHGFESFALVTAYIGYTWMGFIFMFFTVSVAVDVFRMIVALWGYLTGANVSYLTATRRVYVLIPLIAAVCIVGYGYYEARHIVYEKITIYTDKLSHGDSLKIVQISDTHLGLIIGEERLGKIVNMIEAEQPDILVVTGDIVDGQLDRINGLAKIFRGLRAKYGKYAVTGNHEYYAGIRRSIRFMEESGFKVLRGEKIDIGDDIVIAGVDDSTGMGYLSYTDVSEKSLLLNNPGNRFTILLKHRPVVDKTAVGLFDLQLSGHTHAGQIFPFRYVVRAFFPFISGLYQVSKDSLLYVNRGLGTWGPPIRFFASPEITIIELNKPKR